MLQALYPATLFLQQQEFLSSCGIRRCTRLTVLLFWFCLFTFAFRFQPLAFFLQSVKSVIQILVCVNIYLFLPGHLYRKSYKHEKE